MDRLIPIDTIRNVKKIVVHDHCPDGLASAIVLLDAFGGRLTSEDVAFVSHNSRQHLAMMAEPGLLFCDFAPPLERATEFVSAGAIVLDHHERERVEPYGDLGVFTNEPGVCGAVLAYQQVWQRLRVEEDLLVAFVERFTTLAGIRDTWQRDSSRWTEACAQAEALMFWPRKDWIENFDKWEAHNKRLSIGPSLLAKRVERSRELLRSAYEFMTKSGQRVIVVSSLATSDLADMIAEDSDNSRTVALIGFQYLFDSGERVLQLSLRSTSDVPVRNFAASLGGGGHSRAAGAKLKIESGGHFDANPYAVIERAWHAWEDSQ